MPPPAKHCRGLLIVRRQCDDRQARARCFPPSWIAEETDACFIVRDANGQALAYVYVEGSGADARRPTY